MYRATVATRVASLACLCVLCYFASDLASLWYSILAGFALVLLTAEALRRERFEREHQVAGSRRAAELCPVVVNLDDYRRTARRSYAARSSTRDESIY